MIEGSITSKEQVSSHRANVLGLAQFSVSSFQLPFSKKSLEVVNPHRFEIEPVRFCTCTNQTWKRGEHDSCLEREAWRTSGRGSWGSPRRGHGDLHGCGCAGNSYPSSQEKRANGFRCASRRGCAAGTGLARGCGTLFSRTPTHTAPTPVLFEAKPFMMEGGTPVSDGITRTCTPQARLDMHSAWRGV